jgi:hypothetical protein
MVQLFSHRFGRPWLSRAGLLQCIFGHYLKKDPWEVLRVLRQAVILIPDVPASAIDMDIATLGLLLPLLAHHLGLIGAILHLPRLQIGREDRLGQAHR